MFIVHIMHLYIMKLVLIVKPAGSVMAWPNFVP